MERKFYLYTVLRNGKYETLVDAYSNPVIFLLLEKELGNETYMINHIEITKEDYDAWITLSKRIKNNTCNH